MVNYKKMDESNFIPHLSDEDNAVFVKYFEHKYMTNSSMIGALKLYKATQIKFMDITTDSIVKLDFIYYRKFSKISRAMIIFTLDLGKTLNQILLIK